MWSFFTADVVLTFIIIFFNSPSVIPQFVISSPSQRNIYRLNSAGSYQKALFFSRLFFFTVYFPLKKKNLNRGQDT